MLLKLPVLLTFNNVAARAFKITFPLGNTEIHNTDLTFTLQSKISYYTEITLCTYTFNIPALEGGREREAKRGKQGK